MIDTALPIPIFVALEKLARLALKHHGTRTLDAINVRLHDVHMKFVPRGGKLMIGQPDPEGVYWVRPDTKGPFDDRTAIGWTNAVGEGLRLSAEMTVHVGIWSVEPHELRAICFAGKLFTP